jgi:hypothetical protein
MVASSVLLKRACSAVRRIREADRSSHPGDPLDTHQDWLSATPSALRTRGVAALVRAAHSRQDASLSAVAVGRPQRADCAHAADVVTAAGRSALVSPSLARTLIAASAERLTGGPRNASDAGAKQSRFRRRRHRGALLQPDNSSQANSTPPNPPGVVAANSGPFSRAHETARARSRGARTKKQQRPRSRRECRTDRAPDVSSRPSHCWVRPALRKPARVGSRTLSPSSILRCYFE